MISGMRANMNFAIGGVGSSLYPEEQLANATVMQAAIDYRQALLALAHNPINEAATRMKFDCERFFKSHSFRIFCNLDGEALMFRIQDVVDELRKDGFNGKN